jgi:hypothetical protein
MDTFEVYTSTGKFLRNYPLHMHPKLRRMIIERTWYETYHFIPPDKSVCFKWGNTVVVMEMIDVGS